MTQRWVVFSQWRKSSYRKKKLMPEMKINCLMSQQNQTGRWMQLWRQSWINKKLKDPKVSQTLANPFIMMTMMMTKDSRQLIRKKMMIWNLVVKVNSWWSNTRKKLRDKRWSKSLQKRKRRRRLKEKSRRQQKWRKLNHLKIVQIGLQVQDSLKTILTNLINLIKCSKFHLLQAKWIQIKKRSQLIWMLRLMVLWWADVFLPNQFKRYRWVMD